LSAQKYKYEDLDSEGRIYYTDTIPFNYIWNLYELSNIPTYINESDVPFSNLSNIYHLRVRLSDTTIENLYLRLRRREFQNISEAGVQTITDITNVNLTNYVTTNNFISNSNYQIYTFSSGDTNTISMFNSNSYNIESVKSNCQINFTNPSMLNKFFTYGSDGQYQVVVPQFSQDIYNAIKGVDELGNPDDLCINSETLFNRNCFALLPNTKSNASMTLLLPLPLGPTMDEKRLWKGPISCTPAYDLKFSRTIFVIISLVVMRGLLFLFSIDCTIFLLYVFLFI
jgi:hypothetical protein